MTQTAAMAARTAAAVLFLAAWLPLPLGAAGAGDPSAALVSSALTGLDGRAHRIGDWKGKIRVVNFWASWCAPCLSEIALLNGARREWLAEGVEVIGVAVDEADAVKAVAARTPIAYPVLIAAQQGQALMQAGGNGSGALPFTLLIDRRGKIVQRHAGVLDARRLRQWLAQANASNPT